MGILNHFSLNLPEGTIQDDFSFRSVNHYTARIYYNRRNGLDERVQNVL